MPLPRAAKTPLPSPSPPRPTNNPFSMAIELRIKDSPYRSVVLATPTHALILRYSSPEQNSRRNRSTPIPGPPAPQCIVEFLDRSSVDLDNYRPVSSQQCLGTLGLITLNGDVFLSVITGAREVASVRPGESVSRIHAVEFRKWSPPRFYLRKSSNS